jgi:hypothetical protein
MRTAQELRDALGQIDGRVRPVVERRPEGDDVRLLALAIHNICLVVDDHRFDRAVTSGRWTHRPCYSRGCRMSDHSRPFCRIPIGLGVLESGESSRASQGQITGSVAEFAKP